MRFHAPFTFVAFVLAAFLVGGIADARADQPQTTLRVHVETGAQGSPGGVATLNQLTFRFRFADHFYADAVGKSGHVLGSSNYENQFYVALAIGPGMSTGESLDSWEFRLSPRFTHVHHATTASWRDTPFANALGDSDGGVEHRSGLELALGATAPRLGSIRSYRMIWSADIIGNYLPSSDVMKFGIGAVVGFSLSRN